MSQEKRTHFNAQIAEEAAEWFVEFRLGEIDAQDRREFDTWIRTSPEHLRAYLETAALWNEGASLTTHRDMDSSALIALARAEGNIIPFDSPQAPSLSPGKSLLPQRRISRRRLVSIAVALVIVVVGGAATVLWQLGREVIYATAVGERRVLRLEDGSTVELNSRSRIRVRFSQNQRNVELLEGQVLLHVAKDTQRPFIVRSDQFRVRAVGTQFDVNRKAAGTTVTVVEGRVSVYSSQPASKTPTAGGPAAAGSAAILLSAGDQLTVSDQTPHPQTQHANPKVATAWTQGQLVLDSATLADVAEEFNRYSTRRLIIEDHAEPPLRLSGVFATDPDFLLHYLRQRSDITVRETPAEVRIIRHD